MTRKQRRMAFVGLGMLALFAAAALVLSAFTDNLVFFYSPTDLIAKHVPEGRRLRIGGLVEKGSVVKEGTTVHFVITDLTTQTPVSFTGLLPDLFREGQGVVAEGKLGPGGVFLASNVLAKHDEKYMPPEVADALKKSGQWQGDKDKGQGNKGK
ncbi:MAG: cytochrome c maturation protein CcmE [Alphaproteobacteria bacterium]|nr:cytochrome c maturation protein CcmE [Alphaproteobacteria bacterium]